jgi:hypothetical protein
MSGLSSFGFTTGTGRSRRRWKRVRRRHGQGAGATVSLAANSSITAGTISVGDGTLTPGLAGGGPNAPSNPSTLNLGSATNTLNANTILIGNHRTRGIVQWATGVNTGTLLIGGAAGGAEHGQYHHRTLLQRNGGQHRQQPHPQRSRCDRSGGHGASWRSDGGGGSGANKGGVISFDTGVFNVADLKLAVGISGAATGNINGTFNLGNNANSTGTLNVTNSFTIGNVTGGGAAARGSLIIKGGTANIGANIIDVSTAVTSNCTLSLTGGTLNMQGFAIGTTAGGTGGTRTIGSIVLPPLGSSAVLMNLGGNGINNAGLNMNATGNLILEGPTRTRAGQRSPRHSASRAGE